MEEKRQKQVGRDPLADTSEETGNTQDMYSDSTSITKVSTMSNDGYSSQLLMKAKACYNIKKVKKLKENEKYGQLQKEVERQVKDLEQARHGLSLHNAKYEAILLFQQGVLLKEADGSFKKKGAFIEWRKKTFPNQHLRTQQYAQKLAEIGPAVLKYAALGRARILALYSLYKNIKGLDLEKVMKKYPFPDFSKDFNGTLFCEHVDAIITMYRLQSNKVEAGLRGLSFATFEQAQLISAIKKEALKVGEADSLKRALKSEKDQPAFFERYLLNKAVLSYKASEETTPSLDSLLGKFLSDCTEEKLEDNNWVESQKEKFNESTIVETYKRIKSIAVKFNIDLEANQTSTENKEAV